MRALVAGLFCVVAGMFGLYIAVSGKRIDGGLPLIPDAWNQMLGRVMFAAGGVITLLIAGLAFRDACARQVPADANLPHSQAD